MWLLVFFHSQLPGLLKNKQEHNVRFKIVGEMFKIVQTRKNQNVKNLSFRKHIFFSLTCFWCISSLILIKFYIFFLIHIKVRGQSTNKNTFFFEMKKREQITDFSKSLHNFVDISVKLTSDIMIFWRLSIYHLFLKTIENLYTFREEYRKLWKF